MEKLLASTVLIVVKARVREAEALAPVMAEWLGDRCRSVSTVRAETCSPLYDDPDLGLIVVLGGDGTMLGAARRVIGRRIPIVCVNFGRVGFLSDVDPASWREELGAMLETMETRYAAGLRWSVVRAGERVATGHAVNDVVLSRSNLARLVHADVVVDGERMGAVRADGFLLSTAMGSSGYSVGAGGPLLHPAMDAVVFVPICPFLNTIPSMVFPSGTVFRFRLVPGTTESYLTVDGQEGHLLETGDEVEIECVPDCVRLLGRGVSFIRRLRTRSFILQDPMYAGREIGTGPDGTGGTER